MHELQECLDLKGALGGRRRAWQRLTVLGCPQLAASINAVRPLSLRSFRSAPACRRILHTSLLPRWLAYIRGVHWWLFCTLTLAFSASRV